mmetsp:Transcript_16164/g.28318  ORF Transcript_16164/g.28318 Transcript_16164/m.28318 type:complete len:90 (-) Transcript_16164:145-414(-)
MNISASLIVRIKNLGYNLADESGTFRFLETPSAKYRLGRSPSRQSLTRSRSQRGSRRLDHAPSPMALSLIKCMSNCTSVDEPLLGFSVV